MTSPETSNLFDGLSGDLPAERFDTLVERGDLQLERIVSAGHRTPPGQWYDQDRDEWVVLLRGAAILTFEGRDEPLRLYVGDAILIPAHCRHRVEWTDPEQKTVWLALHFRAAV